MIRIFSDRRLFLAFCGLVVLGVCGWRSGADISPYVTAIVGMIAGANAAQGILGGKK